MQYGRKDNKVINLAVVMKSDTAVTALPVIYLAKQDLIKDGLKGPLEGWDVSIQYRNSECDSITAPFEAMDLYYNYSAGKKPCHVAIRNYSLYYVTHVSSFHYYNLMFKRFKFLVQKYLYYS